MEAPEKIVLQEPTKVRTEKLYDNDVEYIRTDVFIDKACEWIKYNNENGGCIFDGWKEDFKKYMKELTIEQKAQRYDEVLRKAKDMLSYKEIRQEDMEYLFPELKESEDERIREELIQFIKNWKDPNNIGRPHDFPTLTRNVEQCDRYIAWLEKQGKFIKIKKGKNYLCTKTHKYAGVEWGEGIKYYSPEDYSLVNRGCTYYCPKYSKEEHNNFFKEVEYDGCLEADKVEPKYHEGDWVIFNENHNSVYQVERIDNYRYYLRHYLGGTLSVHFDNELIRLWTIQDAKNGDVLAGNYGTFIFMSESDGYCGVLSNNTFIRNTGNNEWTEGLYPATKEQRDLLFQKMKEAGYEWNADKKELKKIEQNPTWSVEDEANFQCVLYCINTNPLLEDVNVENYKCWLQSLKQRCTWKPSEGQMNALDSALQYSQVSHNSYEHLNLLYNDLKKLKHNETN